MHLNLRQEDFDRRGRHPALGVVTLSELLATWAAHDLTHLHQIARVMAHQYREAVGLNSSASTKRRTSSTHSLGMRSTCFFPPALKVSNQTDPLGACDSGKWADRNGDE